jgi:hypothetical protein
MHRVHTSDGLMDGQGARASPLVCSPRGGRYAGNAPWIAALTVAFSIVGTLGVYAKLEMDSQWLNAARWLGHATPADLSLTGKPTNVWGLRSNSVKEMGEG